MDRSTSLDQIRYAGRHRIVDHSAPSVAGYDLGELLGSGGTGRVWAAVDANGEEVAVKVVQAGDAEGALIELAVLGRIDDPHLVRMHEALALPDGAVALVLDLCRGGSLGEAIGARGHLEPGEMVTVLSPVASALGRLHDMGVVHGDLAPGNVLLTLDGRPMLADLGVARILGEVGDEVRGTEGFVAPEVLLGGAPSTAGDVFALGALAWLCLTGEVPEPAMVRGRLAEKVPGLATELVNAVEGSLRTRPEDRPDADALAVALFDSARPLPLQLTRGGDEVSLLTRRIREAARAEGSVQLRSGRGIGTSSRPADRRGLARLTVGVSEGAQRLQKSVGRGLRRAVAGGVRGVRWVLPLVAVFLVVGAATAGVMAWAGSRDDAKASPTRPAVSSSGAESAAAPGEGSRTDRSDASPDVLRDQQAPRSQAPQLVQALADARARAWSAGRASELAKVDAPRSPALERDTTVLSGVQVAGQRYVGLSFVVRDAKAVSVTDTAATIRTRIDTGAHVVTGPQGEERRAAEAAAPVLLDLVWTDSGWRVDEVRATDG